MTGREVFGSYLVFAAILFGAVALLVAAGWMPTLNMAGQAAIGSMLLACGASLLASLVGGIPATLAASRPPIQRTNFILASLAIRLLLILGLTLLVVLAVPVPRTPFLLWVVISYLVLLPVDALVALRANRES